MTFQDRFEVKTPGRGTTEITAHVARVVHASGIRRGIVNVFAQHTSCSLTITGSRTRPLRSTVNSTRTRG